MAKDSQKEAPQKAELIPAQGAGGIEPQEPTREDLFIRNLFITPNVKQAALEAGYSKGTSTGPIYQKIKSPRFQAKLVEYAKAHNILNLPKILSIENKAIEYLSTLDGQELLQGLAKSKHTITQQKQISGLLKPEDEGNQRQLTVNIKEIRQLLVQR